ncbi:hypothetical protein [Streptomyces hokutonensis]|uniref:hypothetical protein n=1 Tax=Streptomyces hokutonensis TaxID=1306990 RepID=UPI0037FD17DE
MFLDEETQIPVPPLCEYGKYLSTALLDESTLKDYGRAVGRLDDYLVGLGSDVLSAVESDLIAYRDQRCRWQERPIGAQLGARSRSSRMTSARTSQRPSRLSAPAAPANPARHQARCLSRFIPDAFRVVHS